MCFSANASFGAAGLLAILSIITIKKANTRPLKFLAASPLFFAVQQLAEGILWLTLTSYSDDNERLILYQYPLLTTVATYWFLFFAYIFWPVWIPSVLIAVERNKTRMKLLVGCLAAGIFFASYALLQLFLVGSTASINQHHIVYTPLAVSFINPWILASAYCLSTVIALLVSSRKYLWLVGFISGIAFLVTNYWAPAATVSIWCFFAALITLVILASIVKHPGARKHH